MGTTNWQQHAQGVRSASRRRFCISAAKCAAKWPHAEPCTLSARLRIWAIVSSEPGADDGTSIAATGPACGLGVMAPVEDSRAAAATAISSSRAIVRNTLSMLDNERA